MSTTMKPPGSLLTGLQALATRPALGAPTSPLAKILGDTRQTVSHRWFKGESVTLDGFRFVRCRFEECQIYYFSDDFRIHQCLFDRSIIHHPLESVRAIRLYWLAQGRSGPELGPFGPFKHLDGTYSTDEDVA